MKNESPKKMEQRVSVITLGVRDIARARAFYEALGWTACTPPDSPVCAFDLNGMTLGLYGWDALAEEAKIPADGGRFLGAALAYNVREKSEVAPVLAAAVAAGGTLMKAAEDVFWGGHSGYFADPDGHLWEVAWNPHAPLGPNGEFQWNGVKGR